MFQYILSHHQVNKTEWVKGYCIIKNCHSMEIDLILNII